MFAPLLSSGLLRFTLYRSSCLPDSVMKSLTAFTFSLLQLGAAAGHQPRPNPVLGGADVVAYFGLDESANATMGSSRHTFTLSTPSSPFNSTFWFANEANRNDFARDPARYAPAYGGFCAFGIAFESLRHGGPSPSDDNGGWPWAPDYLGPPADPNVWRLHRGRLFLFFIPGARDVFFTGDPKTAIQKADNRWRGWWEDPGMEDLSTVVLGPFNEECLGPPPRWAVHSCTRNPQMVPGITPGKPVSEACLRRVNALCSASSPSTTKDPMGPECDACLRRHWRSLWRSGDCPSIDSPDPGHSMPASVLEKVYCR
jgi:hypothetical protein